MRVSDQVRKQVEDKLVACLELVESHYGRSFPTPRVAYDVGGSRGGYVESQYCVDTGDWVIHLNPTILMDNVEDFVNSTVPHEFAHIVDCAVNGGFARSRSGRRSIHGASWKAVMRVLGVPANRCHDHNISSVKTHNKSKHVYKCDCCEALIPLGPVRHKKQMRVIKNGGGGYTHSTCGKKGTLTYVKNAGKVSYEDALKSAQKKTAKKKPAKKTKMSRAINIVKGMAGKSKTDIIDVLMLKLDMSKAGATTYYYKAVKV